MVQLRYRHTNKPLASGWRLQTNKKSTGYVFSIYKPQNQTKRKKQVGLMLLEFKAQERRYA